jgi:hypothetical protein
MCRPDESFRAVPESILNTLAALPRLNAALLAESQLSPPQVTDLRQLGQHHGLATAVDPTLEERWKP